MSSTKKQTSIIGFFTPKSTKIEDAQVKIERSPLIKKSQFFSLPKGTPVKSGGISKRRNNSKSPGYRKKIKKELEKGQNTIISHFVNYKTEEIVPKTPLKKLTTLIEKNKSMVSGEGTPEKPFVLDDEPEKVADFGKVSTEKPFVLDSESKNSTNTADNKPKTGKSSKSGDGTPEKPIVLDDEAETGKPPDEVKFIIAGTPDKPIIICDESDDEISFKERTIVGNWQNSVRKQVKDTDSVGRGSVDSQVNRIEKGKLQTLVKRQLVFQGDSETPKNLTCTSALRRSSRVNGGIKRSKCDCCDVDENTNMYGKEPKRNSGRESESELLHEEMSFNRNDLIGAKLGEKHCDPKFWKDSVEMGKIRICRQDSNGTNNNEPNTEENLCTDNLKPELRKTRSSTSSQIENDVESSNEIVQRRENIVKNLTEEKLTDIEIRLTRSPVFSKNNFVSDNVPSENSGKELMRQGMRFIRSRGDVENMVYTEPTTLSSSQGSNSSITSKGNQTLVSHKYVICNFCLNFVVKYDYLTN